MVNFMDAREIYRLEVGGTTICSVSAEVPAFVPTVTLDGQWLRRLIVNAIMAWRAQRP